MGYHCLRSMANEKMKFHMTVFTMEKIFCFLALLGLSIDQAHAQEFKGLETPKIAEAFKNIS